jgi:hypothetical protein
MRAWCVESTKGLFLRGFIPFFGALAGLGALGPARATEVCVGTVAELDAALIAASGPVGPEVVIKLKQGTYLLGDSVFTPEGSRSYRSLQLLGGYTGNCTLRVLDAQNTVFDGEGQHAIFGVDGDLLIEGLRFEDFAPLHENAYGSVVVSATTAGATTRIRNNVIVRTNLAVLGNDYEDITLIVENNLVTGAGLPPQMAGTPLPQALRVDALREDTRTRINNNTIAGNLQGGLRVCSDGPIALGNNIVSGNVGTDVRLTTRACAQPTSGTFLFNLYGTLSGSEAPGLSQGTSHANPMFVSSSNFRLQNGSPAVNSGTLAVAGGLGQWDVEGRARVTGTLPDRGAYESSVNNGAPGTIVVTNTNDAGTGSLRQAMLDANNTPGFNLIDFNIPGLCPARITLQSDLPDLTDGVRIDGYSQPGSSANTLALSDNATRCVIVNGNSQVNEGFHFEGAANADFWLQGVAIEGFNVYGVRVESGDSAQLWGNQFGGSVGNIALAPNLVNIRIGGSVDGATIGGDSPSQLNVIAGAAGYGLMLVNSAGGNSVVGNVFGIRGLSPDPNGGDNIYLTSPDNLIDGNVLASSATSGVRLSGSNARDNLVVHNRIGVACPPPLSCVMSAPNFLHGVHLDGGAHDNRIQYNLLRNNGESGVFVQGASAANRLFGNATFLNGAVGIDLDGVSANDNDSAPGSASLPNRGLNHPVLNGASGSQTSVGIAGTLSSSNGQYTIQVYSSSACDSGGRGEGEVYHGFQFETIGNATGGADGSTAVELSVPVPFGLDMQGRFITALATDGAGNTSEFSNCVAYQLAGGDAIFADGFEE